MSGLIQRLTLRACALIALLALAHGAIAQCNSSGDPIVSVDFGTLGDPDFGGGTTTYRQIPTNQNPNGEGWYKLVTDVNLGLNTWHNLRDHTGNADGLMLVVNASDEPGEFYRIRVDSLCENTLFYFSAWIANANRPTECGGSPIPPNIRFVILDLDGNVVSPAYSTGNIQPTSTPEWRQYGFEFNTGDRTAFELVLINDNPGGCGNDLAIDDIEFRACGPDVNISTDLERYGDTLFMCSGAEQMTFSVAVGAGYATLVYQWQERAGIDGEWMDVSGENRSTLDLIPRHDSWYRVAIASNIANLQNAACRVMSPPIRTALVDVPISMPTPTTMVTCRDSVLLFNPENDGMAGVGPLTYQWYFFQDGNWLPIPTADSENYSPSVAEVGAFLYQRRAVNRCGVDFVVDEYLLEVADLNVTSLILPVDMVCVDDLPLTLVGGSPAVFPSGESGVYSGTGVENGLFYPGLAGIGEHVITYVPPVSVSCAVLSTATIRVVESVVIQPVPQPHYLVAGDETQISIISNGTRFEWAPANGLTRLDIPNPVVSPTETTTYRVTVSNDAGCESTMEITIDVLNELRIPTGFTPNGDGYNDVWNIGGVANYPDISVEVYNRWGALLFYSEGYDTPWDGQFNGSPLPDGAYFFVIKSSFLTKSLTGSVLLMR